MLAIAIDGYLLSDTVVEFVETPVTSAGSVTRIPIHVPVSRSQFRRNH